MICVKKSCAFTLTGVTNSITVRQTVDREDLIDSLSVNITSILDPIIPHGSRVALVGFPNHPNVGDSSIWLGERVYLDSNGVSIAYTCDQSNYSEAELRKRLNDGIILIHGGGNLGDLWPHHEHLRETVIKAFPQNKIIQLPQSVFFKENVSLKRAATVLEKHRDLTVLVRERKSFEFTHDNFDVPCILCPDLAFMLGALDRFMPPIIEILWLSRTDSESRGDQLPPIADDFERTDWLEEKELVIEPGRSTLEGYDYLAKQRLTRGSRILNKGRIVITDRLHGHILSLLLGIPHFILDNSYGKVKSFYETWTKDFVAARWANSPIEALALARAYQNF